MIKKKNPENKAEARKQKSYNNDKKKLGWMARGMALLMIALMLIFTFVTTGIYLLD